MTASFERVLVGEALVGEGPEIAHIDLVIGRKGSSVE
ncbi:MAG TPA: formaldehyde-activating enzyme, partial [Methanothrix sp.]|nr:formaldehyde-activating enzyme [Methanothrix sp.]